MRSFASPKIKTIDQFRSTKRNTFAETTTHGHCYWTGSNGHLRARATVGKIRYVVKAL